MNWVDIAITLAIIIVVLWAATRAGQANPIGTGKLSRRMDALEAKVAEQGVRIGGIEDAVIKLTIATADTSKELAAMRVEMAGDRGLSERTWAAVDRLQNYFIQDAFDKRREGR